MKRKLLTTLLILLLALCTAGFSACGDDVVNFKLSFIVDNQIYATVETNGNQVITLPQSPQKEGFEFDGWYWDENVWEKPVTVDSLLDAPISSDMQVYAKFSKQHVHDYTSVIISPTCTEKGYTQNTCACGQFYMDNETEAVGHTEQELPAISPTCTETGLTAGTKCSVCKATLEAQTIIDALGHKFVNYKTNNDATLTNDGTKTAVCNSDGCEQTHTMADVGSFLEGLTFVDNGESYYVSDCTPDRTTVSLPSIYNGKPVTGIGNFAFFKCYSLESITIPSSVTSIGGRAFSRCSSLKTITFEENSKLESIGQYAFYSCYSLESITIPSSVTSIGDYAFSDCYKLVEVIDKTSLNITTSSYGLSAKQIITDKADSKLVQDGDYSFYNDNGNYYLLSYNGNETEITLPNKANSNSYEIYLLAFYNTKITSITIPSSVTSIGSSAFSECFSLKTITFEENSKLESIGPCAFFFCDSLESITIPSSVTSISNSAFSGCISLKTITFEENSKLESIGQSAFSGCISLESITIPSSVTSIVSSAFSGCYKLVEVIDKTSLNITTSSYGLSAKQIITDKADSKLVQDGDYSFYNDNGNYYLLSYNGNETEITLPNKTNGNSYEIYQYAFYNNTQITSIVIPSSVTSIGSSAFEGCISLKTITFEENSKLESIGRYAFEDCRSLESITIPSSVTSIGYYAFFYCSSLKTITFEKNSKLESIDSYAFYSCYSLESITIPSSVTSIGSDAFLSCSSLKDINFNGTKAQWEAISKGANWNNSTGNYTVHCSDGDIVKETGSTSF